MLMEFIYLLSTCIPITSDYKYEYKPSRESSIWHLLSRNPHQDCLSNSSNGQTKQDLAVQHQQLRKHVQAVQVSGLEYGYHVLFLLRCLFVHASWPLCWTLARAILSPQSRLNAAQFNSTIVQPQNIQAAPSEDELGHLVYRHLTSTDFFFLV